MVYDSFELNLNEFELPYFSYKIQGKYNYISLDYSEIWIVRGAHITYMWNVLYLIYCVKYIEAIICAYIGSSEIC